MRRRQRIPSWLPLLGLALGLLIGVGYTWLVSPVAYVDTAPDSLRADFKEQYQVAIAQAYQANGNLERARARLSLLGDKASAQTLAAQAQRALAGGYPEEAGALALLSSHLQNPPTLHPAASPTPSVTPTQRLDLSPSPTLDLTQSVRTATLTPSPTLTLTPRATFTPMPTATPTSTPGAPFALQNKREICDPNLEHGLLQLEVVNSAGVPVPGMRVLVSWAGGEETFLTGLQPQVSPGYADYQMTPGTQYTVRVGEGGVPAEKLQTHTCTAPNGDPYPGGWYLIFAQP